MGFSFKVSGRNGKNNGNCFRVVQNIWTSTKEWCIGQITVPSNFKRILVATNSPAEGEVEVQGEGEGEGGCELEVICVGLSRTGTSSIKARCKHMESLAGS